MNVINLLLSMYLLTIDSFPTIIIEADAKVGNKANQPGYKLSSVRNNELIIIVMSPATDNAWA